MTTTVRATALRGKEPRTTTELHGTQHTSHQRFTEKNTGGVLPLRREEAAGFTQSLGGRESFLGWSDIDGIFPLILGKDLGLVGFCGLILGQPQRLVGFCGMILGFFSLYGGAWLPAP